jgi:hypothetical protein
VTWHAVALVLASLAAVIYCGSNATCHDVLPYIGGMAMAVVGGVFGLAKQDQARRRRRPIPGDSGGFKRPTPPLGLPLP